MLLAGQVEEKLTAGSIFTPFFSSSMEREPPGSFEHGAGDAPA
jgi:hypothetical protein